MLPTNLSISHILHQVFEDKEVPEQLLHRHQLYPILENGIQQIVEAVQTRPLQNQKLKEIGISILVAVNTRLSALTDASEKQELQRLLIDIVQFLIKEVTARISKPDKFLGELKESLERTSAINGYDFQDLSQSLGLNEVNHNHPSQLSKIPYYEWLGKIHELDEMAKKLAKAKVIASTVEFKKLFTDHQNPDMKVRFNQIFVAEIILLFDQLKVKGLIIPRGNKGHFYPLSTYGTDLSGEFLIKNDPKIIKRNLSKNKAKWTHLHKKVERWLSL